MVCLKRAAPWHAGQATVSPFDVTSQQQPANAQEAPDWPPTPPPPVRISVSQQQQFCEPAPKKIKLSPAAECQQDQTKKWIDLRKCNERTPLEVDKIKLTPATKVQNNKVYHKHNWSKKRKTTSEDDVNKRPAPKEKHARNDQKECTPELPMLVAPAVLGPADPEAATAVKESPRLPLLVPELAPAPLAPALVSVPAGVTATSGGEVADGASSAVSMNNETPSPAEPSSPTEMPRPGPSSPTENEDVDYEPPAVHHH